MLLGRVIFGDRPSAAPSRFGNQADLLVSSSVNHNWSPLAKTRPFTAAFIAEAPSHRPRYRGLSGCSWRRAGLDRGVDIGKQLAVLRNSTTTAFGRVRVAWFLVSANDDRDRLGRRSERVSGAIAGQRGPIFHRRTILRGDGPAADQGCRPWSSTISCPVRTATTPGIFIAAEEVDALDLGMGMGAADEMGKRSCRSGLMSSTVTALVAG